MKSWKESNSIKNIKEYLESDPDKPGYEINHWDTTWAEDNPVDVEAEGIREEEDSEYNFILDLIEDSGLKYSEESGDEYNKIVFDNSTSTFRFYFDQKNMLHHITEIDHDSNATEDEPDMGIWSIYDFDVLNTKRGPKFRIIVNYGNDDPVAEFAIPFY